jgi:sortase A
MFQDRELQELDRTSGPARSRPKTKLQEGALIGQIVIPRLGVSSVILEGTGDTTLRRAIGHVRGTALPGQSGNICLAGHRDRQFRPLSGIAAGDEVRIRTAKGTEIYRVVDAGIVTPQHIDVLDKTSTNTLTLITCYPFDFIGSAPERFIVRARAVGGEHARASE